MGVFRLQGGPKFEIRFVEKPGTGPSWRSARPLLEYVTSERGIVSVRLARLEGAAYRVTKSEMTYSLPRIAWNVRSQ